MFEKLTKQIIHKAAWRELKKSIIPVLQCRCRQDGMPEYGRFTQQGIERITLQTEANIRELMPYLDDLNNIGNYQKQYEGLLTLAIYRSLIEANIETNYAINLLGDIIWQTFLNVRGFIPIIGPLAKKLITLRTKDPMIILGKLLKIMKKYPYSEPGYKINFYEKDQIYYWDTYTCSAYDFYKKFGNEEMKLFRRLWCTLDYAVAERAVEGGKYEREHCLADGDEVCDMRYFVKN